MQETHQLLAIGGALPEFELPGTDGRSHSLTAIAGGNALVIVFLANHCPYVGAWEDRLIAIAREYEPRGVAFAGISSSDTSKFPQDSLAEMEKRGYPFPYLHDDEQAAARAFGATRTPEVFLFDRDRTLKYHGAIDSDWEESEDTQPFLREALEAVVRGKEVPRADTRPIGCALKLRNPET